MTNLINKDGKMSSLEIAKLTNKTHSNVIRDCKVLNNAYEISQLKIEESNYTTRGKEYFMFLLDKMQTMDLMTGYSIKLRIKVNRRWEELENKKPISQIDLIIQSAQMLKANEEKLKEHDSRLLELEAKTTIRPDFFTIAGYGTLRGVKVNLKIASNLGRKASKICKDQGIETGKIRDIRFGYVKTYPTNILKEVFEINLT